jgi:chemotaxis signal transduction protein
VSPASAAAASTFELVHFTVGAQRFAAARTAIRAIRPSPRLRSVLGGTTARPGLPLISLSSVLGMERDTSVDRRVLEVLHWGERLGLEVTGIDGIRRAELSALHPLPSVVGRSLRTRAVLGVVEVPKGLAVVLDLPLLLTERGVTA